jgi:RNA-directed DNA polymerase
VDLTYRVILAEQDKSIPLWYAVDWPTIYRNVRRLQVRIAQATKEGSWGKVRALQRLLTHSYSGKVLLFDE